MRTRCMFEEEMERIEDKLYEALDREPLLPSIAGLLNVLTELSAQVRDAEMMYDHVVIDEMVRTTINVAMFMKRESENAVKQ